MIDIESRVYTPIAQMLREKFPEINVSGEYVKAPPVFPYVSVVEQDNYMTPEHLDNGAAEKFATLMYEVNVYSNKSGTKKSECREIMADIDREMYIRNFTRISLSPIRKCDAYWCRSIELAGRRGARYER